MLPQLYHCILCTAYYAYCALHTMHTVHCIQNELVVLHWTQKQNKFIQLSNLNSNTLIHYYCSVFNVDQILKFSQILLGMPSLKKYSAIFGT